MLSKDDKQWTDDMVEILDRGVELMGKISDEALEYMAEIAENADDKAWRKMAISQQPLEIGMGRALAEKLVPEIYNGMQKNLHKRLKIPKKKAEVLIQIYIGRVISNIVKELNREAESK